jgi:hypothetical protein
MRSFVMADLTASGELQFQETYSYEALERVPDAIELIGLFSGALWRDPEHFELCLDTAAKLTLRWVAVAKTAGIATVRLDGGLISLTLLASGVDPKADLATLEAFQSHLVQQLHDTGVEPAFALLNFKERPLAATVNFTSPPQRHVQRTVALADRCFAAAYFRYQQLV